MVPEMPEATSLQRAQPGDAELLSNLLELYIHDLCDVFPTVELGKMADSATRSFRFTGRSRSVALLM
jgi:hypothetical protein